MKKILFIFCLILILFSLNTKSDANNNEVGIVQTSGSNLNIRSSYTTSSKIIGRIPNNSYVEIISNKNDFYYIKYNNTYGYSSKSYINKLYGKSMTTTDNLNFRTGPSTKYSIITTIKKGTNITIYNTVSNWSYAYFNGNYGYLYNSYLINGKVLNIYDFKQYDSRWKNIKITSNKTISQIGCLTTAMAMSESYRTNTIIYPNEMKNKLSYTPSGDMYWPSNYKTDTTSSYLTKIYKNLLNNKPTIIGAKNSVSSHFVIVYGINGSSSNLSSYLINDPASTTRTTLKDFFTSYPTYLKIASYN